MLSLDELLSKGQSIIEAIAFNLMTNGQPKRPSSSVYVSQTSSSSDSYTNDIAMYFSSIFTSSSVQDTDPSKDNANLVISKDNANLVIIALTGIIVGVLLIILLVVTSVYIYLLGYYKLV